MTSELGLPSILIVVAILLFILGPQPFEDLGKDLGNGQRKLKSGNKHRDMGPDQR